MRYVLIVLWMLFWSVTSAFAQVSIGIGLPGVSIGINLPLYPELVPVPGYPVYYAPRLNSNYFFYDGMYWVYEGDNWYASSWYNGPWGLVGPEAVPLFVLRIPVRYYRQPPAYFRGWQSNAPPRWGDHWGNEWAQHRSGWDKWNHASAPRPAPLPVYQRQYSGDRYPRVEQQQALRSQNYRYQPRDAVVRQHFQEQAVQRAPALSQPAQQKAPAVSSPRQQDMQRFNAPSVKQSAPTAPSAQPPQKGGESMQRPTPAQAPPQKGGESMQRSTPAQAPPQKGGESMQRSAPTQAPPQKGGESMQRPAPMQAPAQKGGESMQRPAPMQAPPQQRAPAVQEQSKQPQQGAMKREQQTPKSSPQNIPQGKGAPQEPKRGQGQEKDRVKGE
jgi:hypothetical protein